MIELTIEPAVEWVYNDSCLVWTILQRGAAHGGHPSWRV
jgi:hypothetical protein